MDFDGDGHLDLVSGSCDPGALYLFRGRGDGRLSAREVIKDKSGKPILKIPNQKATYESFGSWTTLFDWDDDGDLDILVGTFDGFLFLRRNEGSRTHPEYAAANEWVRVGSKPLRVPGGEHADPVIADWDNDGRWDIITGSGEGGVYWYRNIGRRGQPRFASPIVLVAKHEGTGYGELLDPQLGPKPGIRSQIAVVDYDDDGKVDLLLGDYCSYLYVKANLTSRQRREFEVVRSRKDKIAQHLNDSVEKLQERFKRMMNGIPKSEWSSAENSAKWQRMYEELRESPDFTRHMEERSRLGERLLEFVDRAAAGGESPEVNHGFVWLFRRK